MPNRQRRFDIAVGGDTPPIYNKLEPSLGPVGLNWLCAWGKDILNGKA